MSTSHSLPRRTCLAAGLQHLGLGLGLLLHADALIAAGPIRMDSLPLLFVDDSGLASKRDIVRTIHPARPSSGPVLLGENPWEGPRIYAFGSVYHDAVTNLYQLWYLSVPEAAAAGMSEEDRAATGRVPQFRGNGYFLVLYGTSTDGISWTRPNLGLHAFDGSKENNIVYDLNSPTVLRDRFESDPTRRYKMLGTIHRSYYAAYSPDGIHWTSALNTPVLSHSDTITLTQDPNTGEYLAYHKRPAVVRGFDRRVVWLSRSRDFTTWSEPQLVFAPDEADDDWSRNAGERSEVYDMAVFPHAAGYVGLPVMFQMMELRPREKMGAGQSPWSGPLDVQLATSTDGTHWRRSMPRIPVIPRGAPGTFDGGGILSVSSTSVDTATETWVYYTAMATGHGAPIPPKRMTIGRAVWRLHGYASLDAGPEGGRFETKPLWVSAGELLINADASRGRMRVALLEADGEPIVGYELENSEELRTDACHWTAQWRNQRRIPTDRPVRVVVDMDSTRFYSLASGGPSSR